MFEFSLTSIMLLMVSTSNVLTKIEAITFFKLNPQHEITFLDVKGYGQTEDYTYGPAAVMVLLNY